MNGSETSAERDCNEAMPGTDEEVDAAWSGAVVRAPPKWPRGFWEEVPPGVYSVDVSRRGVFEKVRLVRPGFFKGRFLKEVVRPELCRSNEAVPVGDLADYISRGACIAGDGSAGASGRVSRST